MQEGLIKGTGNSRYLKSSIPAGTTWEQALAMLTAGTFPIDLNGINAAGWAVIADALNKANLLPDSVATALGLTGNPQVKDALIAAFGKVGTIKNTARTDLGDNWALCNGDAISRAEYPDASELLPETVGVDWLADTISTGLTGVNKLKYLNGKYVAVGYITSGSTYGAVATADALSGPWSVYQMGSVGALYDATYGGGYWAACGKGGTVGAITYSYDLSTWGVYSLSGSDSVNVNTIAYGNGYFAVAGIYNTYLRVYSGSDPNNITLRVGGTTYTSTRNSNLVYGDGFGLLYNGTNNTIYAITSSNGTSWSSASTGQVWSSSYSIYLTYLNGKYVYWYGTTYIYYASSLASTPSDVALPAAPKAAGYINGLYTFVCYTSAPPVLLTSAAVGGTYAPRALPSGGANAIGPDIMHPAGSVVVHCVGSNIIRSTDDAASILPQITADNAYAYIRVR